MATIWLIADTHFNHANILTFESSDGTLVRPGFANVEEMNEHMIEQWNSVVRPADHVYHLGDLAISRRMAEIAPIVARLHGVKRLVRGNHDQLKSAQYYRMGFTEIHGTLLRGDCWLSHFPIHPQSMGRALGNIHGHIHRQPSPPGQYVCVSVEQTNYRPVNLDEVRQVLLARKTASANVGPAAL